jgi:hypothetical protein
MTSLVGGRWIGMTARFDEKRILFARSHKECDPARVVDGAARPERNGQTPSVVHGCW